jgi:hypothetical protein
MSMLVQHAESLFLQLRIVFMHETQGFVEIERGSPPLLLTRRRLYDHHTVILSIGGDTSFFDSIISPDSQERVIGRHSSGAIESMDSEVEDMSPESSQENLNEPWDDPRGGLEEQHADGSAQRRLRILATLAALALMAVCSASILGMAFSNSYVGSFPSRFWGAMCLMFWALSAFICRGISDTVTNRSLGALVVVGLCISMLLFQTLGPNAGPPTAWTVSGTAGAILAWDAGAMWFVGRCLLSRALRNQPTGASDMADLPQVPEQLTRAARLTPTVGLSMLIVGVLLTEIVFSRLQARDLVGMPADATPRVGVPCTLVAPALRSTDLAARTLSGPVWLYSLNNLVWQYSDGGGEIERIAPNGHVSTCSWPGATLHLADMVQAPDSSLWFIDDNSRMVSHVSNELRLTEYPIPWDVASIRHTSWFTDYVTYANLTPQAIAYGPDGNIWFTNQGGIIGRMTLSGAFTRFDSPRPNGHFTGRLTLGPRRTLLFTVSSDTPPEGCNCVVQDYNGTITMSGVATAIPHPQSGPAWPPNTMKASDGSLWNVEGYNGFSRWTAKGPTDEHTLPDLESTILQMAPGVDANLWLVVSDRYATSSIMRYAIGTDRFVSYAEPEALSQDATGPSWVIPRQDGSVWVVTDDSLWRLSPQGAYTRVGPL